MELVINNILIFKTDIRTAEDKDRVTPMLDANDRIEKWTIDQDDVDCVLRIVSDELSHDEVISLIRREGFQCEELD